MSFVKPVAINTVPSRFAALKIEDDDDFIEITSKKGNKNKPQQQQQQQQQQRQSSSNQKKKNKSKQQNKEVKCDVVTDDWSTWKKKDEEFTEQLFKEQIKQALLESKVQFEMDKKPVVNQNEVKNTKGKIMSLGEFHKTVENPSSQNKQDTNNVKEIDTEKMIKEIDENVEKMLQKEHNRTIETNESTIEKFLSLQYKEEIEKRDKSIENLTGEIYKLKEEVAEVRKRNKQLAFILAQGEMKEKAELLMQIDELIAAKDDLTQQIVQLNANLQQEKSKVHQLENEQKKSKKH